MSERSTSPLAYLSLGHFLVALFVFFLPATAWPHPGGLDAHGCHHDRKAGGYHCHQGPLAGQSFASKAEMLRRLGEASGTSPSPKGGTSVLVSVVRVIDGDTIRVCCLAGREEPVRYIGMNNMKIIPKVSKQAGMFQVIEEYQIQVEPHEVEALFDKLADAVARGVKDALSVAGFWMAKP